MAGAQGDYKVVTVTDGGTISGSENGQAPRRAFWTSRSPRIRQICNPDSRKTVDLERLIIGPQGGVANTVVYLKNISSGKALEAPEQRRRLEQRHSHYVPHILLVPENAALQMQSSGASLHTFHMEGAATFNLPFPFPNQMSDFSHHVVAGIGSSALQRRSRLDERRNDGSPVLLRYR